MLRVQTFKFTISVRAPLPAVANFYPDARALQRLTPPPASVQFRRVKPLGEGSIADFTLWFGLWPVRWVAVHSNVDSLHGFTDTQRIGPMQHWQHTHHFESVGKGTTRVTESVVYAYQPGWRGLLGPVLFNRLTLRLLFYYRGLVTRHALETMPSR